MTESSAYYLGLKRYNRKMKQVRHNSLINNTASVAHDVLIIFSVRTPVIKGLPFPLTSWQLSTTHAAN